MINTSGGAIRPAPKVSLLRSALRGYLYAFPVSTIVAKTHDMYPEYVPTDGACLPHSFETSIGLDLFFSQQMQSLYSHYIFCKPPLGVC